MVGTHQRINHSTAVSLVASFKGFVPLQVWVHAQVKVKPEEGRPAVDVLATPPHSSFQEAFSMHQGNVTIELHQSA